MKLRYFLKIFLLFIPLFLCSCGSLIKQPAPIISYYQLDYTPENIATSLVDKTILIRSFYINETYNRDTIMYSDEKYKCGFYPYKQWISSPQVQITESFIRDFMASGIFKGIIIPGQLHKYDLILTGAIIDIKEKIENGKAFGVLNIAITLSKTGSDRSSTAIIFQKDYKKTVPCEINNTKSLVKALSEATKEISSEVIKDIVKVSNQ